MTFFHSAILFFITIPAFSQVPVNQAFSWPEEYEPSKSKFFVHNEIEIKARPETVWSYLINALEWSSWYTGAENVKLINQDDRYLAANSRFQWETMGLTFESLIMQFEPNKLLAWESKKKQIQGYHMWLIIPTEYGCKVITDESQNGWLTFFEKLFQGKKLSKLHNTWLSELKIISENHENLSK